MVADSFALFRFGLAAIAALWAITNVSAQQWTSTVMANMPEPVSNNAVCEGFVDGVPYVYSFGGIDTNKNWTGIHLRSFRYSTATDTWETIPALPDTMGKVAAGASFVNGKIYIIGGYHVHQNGNEYTSGKVHIYNPATNAYEADGAETPVPIDDHVQVVWRDSLIICITGWSGAGASGTNVPDVQIYNPANNTWTAADSVPDNNNYKSFGASGTIIGDTIYYFGGARFGFNFPASNSFVKGAINPNDPTDIAWTQSVPNTGFRGYRMACTQHWGHVYWLGGSQVTYNYNGIAYNGSGGVPPVNRNLHYSQYTGQMDTMSMQLPMDLRGIAHAGGGTRYIAGGMVAGQQVTDQTLRLEFLDATGLAETPAPSLELFPNPASEEVTLAWAGNEPTSYIITNLSGQQLKQGNLTGNTYRLSIATLSAGVYFVTLRTNHVQQVRKLVISRP